MKKSTLLLILSLILAVALGTGSTLAYLSDTDHDVNTMTLGSVKIVQNEQEWVNGALDQFTQKKPLYPYVGDMGWNVLGTDPAQETAYRQFTMKNVVDKYVTVTNIGKSPAYVRTIIAAEMGKYATVEEFRNKVVGFSRNEADGAEFDFPGAWVWDTFEVISMNGQNWLLMVATHQDAIAPRQTTIPSLLQVYMNKACDNAEMEKVDGNGNGLYDIMVLSQAVQTQGFEAETDAEGNVTKSAAQVALEAAFPYVTADATKADTIANWFATTESGSPGKKNDSNNPPVFATEAPTDAGTGNADTE